MPLYQYHCDKCDKTVEELRKISEMNNIPKCKKADCEMKKIIFTTGLKISGKGVYSPGFHVNSTRKK